MSKAIREVIYTSWPTLVVLIAIFIIMRVTIFIKGDSRKVVIHEELFNLLFFAYLLILFGLVTSQDIQAYNGTNFMPFREILRYDIGTSGFYKQVIGNILLFIPFGYFVSAYCKIKGLGTITIVSLLSSLVIECVQHYIGRSFDVDDIILNVIGGIHKKEQVPIDIGFLLYISLNAIRTHLPKLFRKDWFLNLISIIVIVLIALYIFKVI